MKSSAEFENIIREIYEFTCEGGTNILSCKILTNKGLHELFIKKTHEGFKKGQNLIFNNLILIEKENISLKEQLKNINSKVNKEVIKNNLKVLGVREQILRKLADSIAWQLIRGEHYIARRLYQQETYPSLLSTGIEEVQNKTNELNKDPFSFALISDITSFIQIGDIVYVNGQKKTFTLLEIKSGKMNELAFEYINKYEGNLKKISQNEEVNKNLLKQIQRIIKQEHRRKIASNLIIDEGGIDPVSGIDYKAIKIETKLISYNDIIIRSIQQLSKKNWMYNVVNYGYVDTIIHIGAYKGSLLSEGKQFIEEIVKKNTDNYIVFSFTDNLYTPISPPLFMFDLPKEIKFDLCMGRIAVYLGLDLDNLIYLFKEFDIKVRWLSRKETAKLKEGFEKNKNPLFFIHKNKAIGLRLSENKDESLLGDGIIARILSDNIHPYSVVKAYIESMNNDS